MAVGHSGAAQAGLPGASPAEPQVEPVVHYSYLGLALLLYGTLAGWSVYHVGALAVRLELDKRPIPAFSAPLFWSVGRLGSLLFLPLAAFVLAEFVMPRKLTRLWLAATLFLVLAGIYVAIALWLPARGAMIS